MPDYVFRFSANPARQDVRACPVPAGWLGFQSSQAQFPFACAPFLCRPSAHSGLFPATAPAEVNSALKAMDLRPRHKRNAAIRSNSGTGLFRMQAFLYSFPELSKVHHPPFLIVVYCGTSKHPRCQWTLSSPIIRRCCPHPQMRMSHPGGTIGGCGNLKSPTNLCSFGLISPSSTNSPSRTAMAIRPCPERHQREASGLSSFCSLRGECPP